MKRAKLPHLTRSYNVLGGNTSLGGQFTFPIKIGKTLSFIGTNYWTLITTELPQRISPTLEKKSQHRTSTFSTENSAFQEGGYPQCTMTTPSCGFKSYVHSYVLGLGRRGFIQCTIDTAMTVLIVELPCPNSTKLLFDGLLLNSPPIKLESISTFNLYSVAKIRTPD